MSTWRRMKKELLADRRKLGLGVTVCCLALLLWGRLLIKKVPRTAEAQPKAVPTEVATATPLKSAVESRESQTIVLPLYGPVERDLFAFDPQFFPQADQSEQTLQSIPKSIGNPADDLSRTQQELQSAVALEGRNLKLQSTLMGKISRAMINGVLMEPGDRIQGFELKEVRPRQVTLVKDDIEVVLEM